MAAVGASLAVLGAFLLAWQAGILVVGAVLLLAAADLGRQ
jgi:hypothetical protein